MGWIEEKHPKLILDRVGGDLAVAYRTVGDAADHGLGVFQNEPIARLRRDRRELEERILDAVGRVQVGVGVPAGAAVDGKESRQVRDVVGGEAHDEVILLHRRLRALLEPIPELVDSGIAVGVVVGQAGTDDLDRWGLDPLVTLGVFDDTSRRRAGAHQAELIAGAVRQHDACEEEVLEDVAADQPGARIIGIEEGLPGGHRLGIGHRVRLLPRRCVRARRAGGNPRLQGLEIRLGDGRQPEGHPYGRVLFQLRIECRRCRGATGRVALWAQAVLPVSAETGSVVAHARGDHLVKQRGVQVLLRRAVASEDGIEAALAPRLRAIGGVHVRTRVIAEVGRIGIEPEATAIDAAKRVQLHIAGRA